MFDGLNRLINMKQGKCVHLYYTTSAYTNFTKCSTNPYPFWDTNENIYIDQKNVKMKNFKKPGFCLTAPSKHLVFIVLCDIVVMFYTAVTSVACGSAIAWDRETPPGSH